MRDYMQNYGRNVSQYGTTRSCPALASSTVIHSSDHEYPTADGFGSYLASVKKRLRFDSKAACPKLHEKGRRIGVRIDASSQHGLGSARTERSLQVTMYGGRGWITSEDSLEDTTWMGPIWLACRLPQRSQ